MDMAEIVKRIYADIKDLQRRLTAIESKKSTRTESTGSIQRTLLADRLTAETDKASRLCFVLDVNVLASLAGDLQLDFGGEWISIFGIVPETTVAGLAALNARVRVAYATDGRKPAEGAGLGTGVLVFRDNALAWISVLSGTAVAA